MSAGKGDTPRPRSITEQEYTERWEQTFGGTDEIVARLDVAIKRRMADPTNKAFGCGGERDDLGYRLAALICRFFGHRIEERVTGRFRCTRCLRWEP